MTSGHIFGKGTAMGGTEQDGQGGRPSAGIMTGQRAAVAPLDATLLGVAGGQRQQCGQQNGGEGVLHWFVLIRWLLKQGRIIPKSARAGFCGV